MAFDKTILKRKLQTQPASSLWTNLLGAWFFDDGSGAQVTDYSGNAYHLTISGVTEWVANGLQIDATSSPFVGGAQRWDIPFDPSNSAKELTILWLAYGSSLNPTVNGGMIKQWLYNAAKTTRIAGIEDGLTVGATHKMYSTTIRYLVESDTNTEPATPNPGYVGQNLLMISRRYISESVGKIKMNITDLDELYGYTLAETSHRAFDDEFLVAVGTNPRLLGVGETVAVGAAHIDGGRKFTAGCLLIWERNLSDTEVSFVQNPSIGGFDEETYRAFFEED